MLPRAVASLFAALILLPFAGITPVLAAGPELSCASAVPPELSQRLRSKLGLSPDLSSNPVPVPAPDDSTVEAPDASKKFNGSEFQVALSGPHPGHR